MNKNFAPKQPLVDLHFFKAERLGSPFFRAKPVPFVIKDFVARGTTSVVHAAPASGKSWVALSMAACVATGKPWHGKQVNQGAVIYIFLEGWSGSMARLAAWEIANETSLQDAPFFITPQTFNFQMLDGTSEPKGDESSGLDKRAAIEDLVDGVLAIEREAGMPTALLVIDVYSRSLGGADRNHNENSAETANLFLSHLGKLTQRKQKTAAVLVHHNALAAQRMRGSSALAAGADSIFSVEKEGDEFILTCVKQKDMEISETKFFKLRKIKIADWNPTDEDIAEYEAMGIPVPFNEEIWSAAIEENVDILSVVIVFDRDQNPIYVLDVLNEIGVRAYLGKDEKTGNEQWGQNKWKDFKTFAENLNLNTEGARKALASCLSRKVIERDDKAYLVSEFGQRLMTMSGDELNDEIFEDNGKE